MHFTCMYNMYTKFGKFFMNAFLNYLQWQIFEEFSGCWKCIFNGENKVNLLPDFSGHFPVHSREMGFDAKKIWRIKNKKIILDCNAIKKYNETTTFYFTNIICNIYTAKYTLQPWYWQRTWIICWKTCWDIEIKK